MPHHFKLLLFGHGRLRFIKFSSGKQKNVFFVCRAYNKLVSHFTFPSTFTIEIITLNGKDAVLHSGEDTSCYKFFHKHQYISIMLGVIATIKNKKIIYNWWIFIDKYHLWTERAKKLLNCHNRTYIISKWLFAATPKSADSLISRFSQMSVVAGLPYL